MHSHSGGPDKDRYNYVVTVPLSFIVHRHC